MKIFIWNLKNKVIFLKICFTDTHFTYNLTVIVNLSFVMTGDYFKVILILIYLLDIIRLIKNIIILKFQFSFLYVLKENYSWASFPFYTIIILILIIAEDVLIAYFNIN